MATAEINMNDNVWVKFTDEGLRILQEKHEALSERLPYSHPWKLPEVNEDGWSRRQLWTLFADFGAGVWLGCEPPFETTVLLSDPQERETAG